LGLKFCRGHFSGFLFPPLLRGPVLPPSTFSDSIPLSGLDYLFLPISFSLNSLSGSGGDGFCSPSGSFLAVLVFFERLRVSSSFFPFFAFSPPPLPFCLFDFFRILRLLDEPPSSRFCAVDLFPDPSYGDADLFFVTNLYKVDLGVSLRFSAIFLFFQPALP